MLSFVFLYSRSKLGRPPKYKTAIKQQEGEEPPVKKRKYQKKIFKKEESLEEVEEKIIKDDCEEIKEDEIEEIKEDIDDKDDDKDMMDEEEIDEEEEKAKMYIEQSKVEIGSRESWPKHSQFLQKYLKMATSVKRWPVGKVAHFVSSLPGCNNYAEKFNLAEIDGEAFLSLTQKDLIDVMKVRVGPAIKIYNMVVLLREKSRSAQFSC